MIFFSYFGLKKLYFVFFCINMAPKNSTIFIFMYHSNASDAHVINEAHDTSCRGGSKRCGSQTNVPQLFQPQCRFSNTVSVTFFHFSQAALQCIAPAMDDDGRGIAVAITSASAVGLAPIRRLRVLSAVELWLICKAQFIVKQELISNVCTTRVSTVFTGGTGGGSFNAGVQTQLPNQITRKRGKG